MSYPSPQMMTQMTQPTSSSMKGEKKEMERKTWVQIITAAPLSKNSKKNLKLSSLISWCRSSWGRELVPTTCSSTQSSMPTPSLRTLSSALPGSKVAQGCSWPIDVLPHSCPSTLLPPIPPSLASLASHCPHQALPPGHWSSHQLLSLVAFAFVW